MSNIKQNQEKSGLWKNDRVFVSVLEIMPSASVWLQNLCWKRFRLGCEGQMNAMNMAWWICCENQLTYKQAN